MSQKKRLVIGNWKMKLSYKESLDLAQSLVEGFKGRDDLEVVVCPCYVALPDVAQILSGSTYRLGAQDAFYHEAGSYTGEVSPEVLREVGCEFVVVGHSERRKYTGETDEDVNRKIKASLDNNLIPIMCVGETLDERREELTDLTIVRQVTKGLEDIKFEKGQRLIVAYEPVWAISPAPSARPEDVKEVMQIIHSLLRDFFEPDVLEESISLIYGGSVDAKDANGFMNELCEGVIVGAESLKSKNFIDILKNIKF